MSGRTRTLKNILYREIYKHTLLNDSSGPEEVCPRLELKEKWCHSEGFYYTSLNKFVILIDSIIVRFIFKTSFGKDILNFEQINHKIYFVSG